MQVKLLTAHVTLHHKNTGQDTEELVGFPRKTDKESILYQYISNCFQI
jgi:hypothetical protein